MLVVVGKIPTEKEIKIPIEIETKIPQESQETQKKEMEFQKRDLNQEVEQKQKK